MRAQLLRTSLRKYNLRPAQEEGRSLGFTWKKSTQAEGMVTQGPEVGACWVLRVQEWSGGRRLRAARGGPVCRACRPWAPVWKSTVQLTFHKDLLAVAGRADCRGEGRSRRPVRGLNQSGRGRCEKRSDVGYAVAFTGG